MLRDILAGTLMLASILAAGCAFHRVYEVVTSHPVSTLDCEETADPDECRADREVWIPIMLTPAPPRCPNKFGRACL